MRKHRRLHSSCDLRSLPVRFAGAQQPRCNVSIPSMRIPSFLLIAISSCGGGSRPTADAQIDATTLTLDCATYCAEIEQHCTGSDAQYPDIAHCMATCPSFPVGTSTVADTAGNTLGCRIYYAHGPAMTAPASYCAHAGPGGDLITAATPAFCSGGDVCASFCALEIKACGSRDSPLPGNPMDDTGNRLAQYRTPADCMRLCPGFDRTHEYSTMATGDSLACRLRYAISAAISVDPDGKMYCSSTGDFPNGPCAGAATP